MIGKGLLVWDREQLEDVKGSEKEDLFENYQDTTFPIDALNNGTARTQKLFTPKIQIGVKLSLTD